MHDESGLARLARYPIEDLSADARSRAQAQDDLRISRARLDGLGGRVVPEASSGERVAALVHGPEQEAPLRIIDGLGHEALILHSEPLNEGRGCGGSSGIEDAAADREPALHADLDVGPLRV